VSEKSHAGERQIVFYRCPNPTNVLCPCGAVARRLRKLELEHRTERVPYRRSSRPEIEELTDQTRVPVLVDGDEVIHDSKRIIQYLDWKYRKDAQEKGPGAGDEVAGGDAEHVASSGLYNLKRWTHRKKQSS
jgi:glutathione S-transferase-like protein